MELKVSNHVNTWVCDALTCCDIHFLYRRRSGAPALTGHTHNPGRNVALPLAIAGLFPCRTGRGVCLFRIVHPETVPCGEEHPCVFPGVAFKVLLHLDGGD